jgi:putative ABC transport system permease protein
VLVVDENNELDDITLYALGLKAKKEIDDLASAAVNKTEPQESQHKWTYKEICENEYRIILNSDCYTLDEKSGLYTDLRETPSGLKYLYDNGISLKVTGIIKPNEDASSTMLTGSIGYTKALTEYVIKKSHDSKAIKAQQENPHTDIFNNLPFSETTSIRTDADKRLEFEKYLDTLDQSGKAQTYIKIMSIPAKSDLDNYVNQALKQMEKEDIETVLTTALTAQTGMNEAQISDYLSSMSDDDLNKALSTFLAEQYKTEYAQNVRAQMSAVPENQLALALENARKGFTLEQYAVFYDEIMEFSTFP